MSRDGIKCYMERDVIKYYMGYQGMLSSVTWKTKFFLWQCLRNGLLKVKKVSLFVDFNMHCDPGVAVAEAVISQT